jgi:class 3 adenylate cyclase
MKMMTDYYSEMQHIIDDCQGTGGEFIGDGLIAFWNSPDDVEGKIRVKFRREKREKREKAKN